LLFRKLKQHHNNADQDDPGKDLLKHQNIPLLKGHEAGRDLSVQNLSLLKGDQAGRDVSVQNISLLKGDQAGRDVSVQNLELPTIFDHVVMLSNMLKMSPWNASARHW
jgi:hypothetical protein